LARRGSGPKGPDPKEKIKALYKRLVITSFDFGEARQFLAVLRKTIADEKTEDPAILRKAIETALVIAYIRPFSGNQSASDVASSPPNRILKSYSREERALHDRLLGLRNTEFAHADAEAAQVKVHISMMRLVQFTLPVSRALRVPLSEGELELIETMLSKLHVAVYDEMRAIEQQLTFSKSF
jgi:hypothetical protein